MPLSFSTGSTPAEKMNELKKFLPRSGDGSVMDG
jgi:hypothetical protein